MMRIRYENALRSTVFCAAESNKLEDWGGVDRHHFDAIVEDYDFQNTYLPVFRGAAASDEGAAAANICKHVPKVPALGPLCAHTTL